MVQYSRWVVVFTTGLTGIVHALLLNMLTYTGVPPGPAYSQSPGTVLHVMLVVAPELWGSKVKCKVNNTALSESVTALPKYPNVNYPGILMFGLAEAIAGLRVTPGVWYAKTEGSKFNTREIAPMLVKF